MFCNRCGANLPPTATVCTSCGAPAPTASDRGGGLQSHLSLLTIFWYIVAALSAIPVLVLFGIGTAAGTAIGMGNAPPEARMFAPFFFYFLAALFSIAAVATFFTAWGLQKRKPWARTLAIVMAFLSLLSVPFGTALGIYTLVVLLPAPAGQEYERMAESRQLTYSARA